MTHLKLFNVLEYMLTKNNQIECIQNYREGKTNHRSISETYQRLKRKHYWPNMFNDLQKYINNCEFCQITKYERDLYEIADKLTPNPDFPFDSMHLYILTFTQEKYLTIIVLLNLQSVNIYLQHQ